jgi:hypothetical protein
VVNNLGQAGNLFIAERQFKAELFLTFRAAEDLLRNRAAPQRKGDYLRTFGWRIFIFAEEGEREMQPGT